MKGERMIESETCATLDAQHINFLIRNKIALIKGQNLQNGEVRS